jgi:hypothetical protein
MTSQELIREIEAQRLLMIAVATGGPRILDVANEYTERREKIGFALAERGIEDPNPYSDLWRWYAKWSDGSLPSYSSRRQFITNLFDPLIERVRQNRMPANYDLILRLVEEMEEFKLNVNSYYNDSEYSSFVDDRIRGKVISLRAHLQRLGSEDLVQELDGVELEEGKLVFILETLRGFIIPEARRRVHSLMKNAMPIKDETQLRHSEGSLPHLPNISCPLRIFLCHSSGDKPAVRDLYRRLLADGFEAWLDEESLLPGQNWQEEIPQAVRNSDVVVVCLSHSAINKEGYVQREIKFALDVADEKPEGTIFIIPLKLEECTAPARLSRWQWVNFFEERGYERLMKALSTRAAEIRVRQQPSPPTLKLETPIYDDQLTDTQRSLLREVESGRRDFQPDSKSEADQDKALEKFQPVAEELIELGKRDYLRNVKPQQESWTGKRHFAVVMVDGLTAKGRRSLQK